MLLVLLGMIVALVLDKMRPGIILLSATVMFLCTGILSPTEMLEGFSNKGMITVQIPPNMVTKERGIKNLVAGKCTDSAHLFIIGAKITTTGVLFRNADIFG